MKNPLLLLVLPFLILLCSCVSYNNYYLTKPVTSGASSGILVTALYINKSYQNYISRYKMSWKEASDQEYFRKNFSTLSNTLKSHQAGTVKLLSSGDTKSLLKDLGYSEKTKDGVTDRVWDNKYCKKCIQDLMAKEKAKWMIVPTLQIRSRFGDYNVTGGRCPHQSWPEFYVGYLLLDAGGNLVLDSFNIVKMNWIVWNYPYVVQKHGMHKGVSDGLKCRVEIKPELKFAPSVLKLRFLLPGETPPGS